MPIRFRRSMAACLAATLVTAAGVHAAETISLSDLDLSQFEQDFKTPQANQSVDGNPITIARRTFQHGVGGHGLAIWWIDLGGTAHRFTAFVGVDDEVRSNPESANFPLEFRVYGDQKIAWHSGPMRAGDPPKPVDLDLTGVQDLALVIQPLSQEISFAHGDWADANIIYDGQTPAPTQPPGENADVLTPTPPPEPRINGAMVFGVRPKHPVIYTIAATGDRPMTFSADGLPGGLKLDPQTGLITGAVPFAGDFPITLKATNAHGSAQRVLQLKVRANIALTPPMGWNSWNCFAHDVSDAKVRSAADAMVDSGLIQHGWSYINIDDCWQVDASEPADARRNKDGSIKSNEKFPDMKSLADYIHSKGLRAGIYSSPGPSTCGGFTASFGYEQQDAHQYAQWGFDYLKYDWCSYGDIFDAARKRPAPPPAMYLYELPYRVMDQALRAQDRDIVFSLCQYGYGDVWTWGQSVGGNCWRTTGDITDNWSRMSSIGFHQAGKQAFAGPGHWNDPDMLVVGNVGWGEQLHPTKLTPNEQFTHISLWCLLSAPLLIGCDMTQLDPFTLGLLSNDEVLAVDQDPLGRQAAPVFVTEDGQEVWAKTLSDGTKAVGLFNRGEMPATIKVQWDQIGLAGKQTVRDLWRQNDLGQFDNEFTSEVPRHGVLLLKIGQPN